MTITRKTGKSPNPPNFDYEEWGVDEEGQIHHFEYGRWWPRSEPWDRLYVELWAFREGRTEEQGGLGKYAHAVNAVNLLWNSSDEGVKFIWTPWAEKMTREACEHQYLNVAGCASSGKSHWAAMWALLNWIAAPEETLCLVTSTSLNAARQRVYGSILHLWNALPKSVQSIGKLVDSVGAIRFVRPDGTKAPDNVGVVLIASEPRKDAQSVGKIIGRKQKRMFLLCDELSELSEAINTAAYSNLCHNPEFYKVDLSNPNSYFDAFGTASEPVQGWEAITEFDYEWLTKRGKCIRFDILQSENYLQKKRVYPFMASYEAIEKARQDLGENSLAFMRMFRGMWPPQGSIDTIFNSIDLLNNVLKENEVRWDSDPTPCAALDLSYTSQGDRNIFIRGSLGTVAKKKVLKVEEVHVLHQDAVTKNHNHTAHICNQVRNLLEEHKIQHRHFAYDATAGGSTFGDMLVQYLSFDILPVNFAGKASDRRVSAAIRDPAHTRYTNRVSELWHIGVEFLRGRQLACLPASLMAEMSQRTYTTGSRGMITVEPKSEMKKKTGRSPDESDAFMALLALCRERLHFTSEERGAGILPTKDYFKKLQEYDVVTLSTGGHDWLPSGEY